MKLLDYWGSPIKEDAYIVRATEFGQYINCPRNWMFGTHNGLNLEPAKRSPKLRFGTIWHEAMEAIYDPGHASGDPFTAIDDAFAGERQVFEDTLGVEMYDPDLVEQLNQEEQLAKQLLTAYEAWRNSLADPPDSWLNYLGAERRYVIPIADGIYIAVKYDVEALDPQGGYWVMEHKTRGKSSDVSNPPELELDFQMGIQLLVASYVREEPVRGVLYNLARKQAPSSRVKKDIFGRHKVPRTDKMLGNLKTYVLRMSREMKTATNIIRGDWEYATRRLRYNPQPNGFCAWGCGVKNICESINRGEDLQYLVNETMSPRGKNIWQVLEEELQQ